MFVKVVHDDNSHTLYECSSYQYTRWLTPHTKPDVGAALDDQAQSVEILLCKENGDVTNSLAFIEEFGNKTIYVMNNNGKTIEVYHIVWPMDPHPIHQLSQPS